MASTTTLPYYFGEIGSVDPLDSATYEFTTTGVRDTTMTRCAIGVTSPGSGFLTPKWADASTCCLRVDLLASGGNAWFGEVAILQWYTNAGTEVLRLTMEAFGALNTTIRLYTLQSGVLTLVGSTTIPNARHKYAIKLVGNSASGSAELYIAGTQRISGNGLNHAGFAGTGQMQGNYSYAIGGTSYWSQGKVSTDLCFNDILTLDLNTDGAVQQMTGGGNAAINEIVYSDATTISTNTNGQYSTFKPSSIDLSGYTIEGIGVDARLKCGASGLQNAAVLIYTGGTPYANTTRAAANGYQATCGSWTTNPATSGALESSDVEAFEYGVKGIT